MQNEKIVITGGVALRGEVGVHGSKNAATKLMVASILTDEECIIENVPLSQDTDITRELCERIGSDVSFDGHTVSMRTATVKTALIPELSRRNRIPILALGPLLHRAGVAEVPVVGGCYLGHRPVNFHIDGLVKMGARIERRENSYYAEARKLHGADIELPFPSVGATENIILAAVCASGKTTITNCAVEPEIENLVLMLVAMGADIIWKPEERRAEIRGVVRLKGVRSTVIPDRNEVVSFAIASLATRGSVLVRGAEISHLTAFLKAVDAVGGEYRVEKDGIRFTGGGSYRPITIETAPHPAFMTDWQQPFCVLLTQASGASIIHETVYEDRFSYTKDIVRMGANIKVLTQCPKTSPCRFGGKSFEHCAHIEGPTALSARDIVMTDIRAGMAHIIAALAASGTSAVSGIEHIDRGYEDIDGRLRALGADIKRIHAA